MIINFNPCPVLESNRLRIRKITDEDVNEVLSLRADAETMKYISKPLMTTSQDALDYIKLCSDAIAANESINLAITEQQGNKLIGMICLIRLQPVNRRAEIGYILHRDYRGRGIINKAVQLIIDYAFKVLRFHSLEALIDPANVASEKVLLRHNFIKEGHFIENRCFNGKYLDSAIYSLLNKQPS